MVNRYPVGDFPFDDRELERLLREQEDERARTRSLNVPPSGFNAQPGIVPLSMWREVQQQEFLVTSGQTILEEDGKDLAFNDLVDEIPISTGRERIQRLQAMDEAEQLRTRGSINFDNRAGAEARTRMTEIFSRPLDREARQRTFRNLIGERFEGDQDVAFSPAGRVTRVYDLLSAPKNSGIPDLFGADFQQETLEVTRWLLDNDADLAHKYRSGRLLQRMEQEPPLTFNEFADTIKTAPLRGLGEFAEFLEERIDQPFRQAILKPFFKGMIAVEYLTGADWLIGDVGEAIGRGEEPTGVAGEAFKAVVAPSFLIFGPAGRTGLVLAASLRTTKVARAVPILEALSRADVAVETGVVATIKLPFRGVALGARTGNQVFRHASEELTEAFRSLDLPGQWANFAANRPLRVVSDVDFMGAMRTLEEGVQARPVLAGSQFGPFTTRVAEANIPSGTIAAQGEDAASHFSETSMEVLRVIDLAERTQPLVTGFLERAGHMPILGPAVRGVGGLWTNAVNINPQLHIVYRAFSDFLHHEAVQIDTQLGDFMQQFRGEFGNLTGVTPRLVLKEGVVRNSAHDGIYGTLLDAIERPNLYDLNPAQQKLINDFQTFLDTDIDATISMGGNWERTWNNYVPHADVRDAGRRYTYDSAITGSAPAPREYASAAERLTNTGTPANPITGNGFQPVLDIETLYRARLYGSARERANQVLINGVRGLADDVTVEAGRKAGFSDIKGIMPELSGLQFTDEMAANVQRLFGEDALRGHMGPEVLESFRQLMLSTDASFLSIHGQLAFMSTSPHVFVRSIPTVVHAFMSTDFYVNYAKEHAANFSRFTRSGGKLATAGNRDEYSVDIWRRAADATFTRLEAKVGTTGAEVLTRAFPLPTAIPRFTAAMNERGFQRAVTIFRINNFENNVQFAALLSDDVAMAARAGRPIPTNLGDFFFLAEAALRSTKFDPELLYGAAARITNSTIPIVNMADFALSQTRRAWERLALISPSFFRGPLELTQAALTDFGPRGMLARRAAINMATMGSVMVATLNTAFGCANVQDSLNPTSNDFWKVCTPWGNFTIGATYRGLARAIIGADNPVQGLTDWGEGRQGIGVSAGGDLLTNEDFFGNSIWDNADSAAQKVLSAGQHLAEGVIPLPGQAAVEGVRDNLSAEEFAFTVGGAFLGVNAYPPSPFDERDRSVRNELSAGDIAFEHIDAKLIDGYFDLPLTQQLAWDTRHPDVAAAILDRGNSAHAEYRRIAEGNIQGEATNVRAAFEQLREGSISARTLLDAVSAAKTAVWVANRTAAELLKLDVPIDLQDPDPNQRAVAEFYNVFSGTCSVRVETTGEVSDRINQDCVARELFRLENGHYAPEIAEEFEGWTAEQREWVEQDTGSARKRLAQEVPAMAAVIDLQDELSQSPYWGLEQGVWDSLSDTSPLRQQFATYDAYQSHIWGLIAEDSKATELTTGFTNLEQLSGVVKDFIQAYLGTKDFALGLTGIDYMQLARPQQRNALIDSNPRLGAILVALGYRTLNSFSQQRRFVLQDPNKGNLPGILQTLSEASLVPDGADPAATTTQIGRPTSAESIRALDLFRTTTMTQAEIGTELNISTRAVEAIVFRARQAGESVDRPSTT